MAILLINGNRKGYGHFMSKAKKVDLKNLEPEEQLKYASAGAGIIGINLLALTLFRRFGKTGILVGSRHLGYLLALRLRRKTS